MTGVLFTDSPSLPRSNDCTITSGSQPQFDTLSLG